MRFQFRHIAAALVIAGGTVAGALTGIPAASASTTGCTSGPFSAYCQAVTDLESPTALTLDVFRQGAAVNQPVIGYYNSDGDKATDLLVLNNKSGGVFFVYAPNGAPTDLCLSEPFQGAAVILRVCNGSKWQTYTERAVNQTAVTGVAATSSTPAVVAVPGLTGTALVNNATKDILSVSGLRKPVVGVSDPLSATPVGTYAANEVFAGLTIAGPPIL